MENKIAYTVYLMSSTGDVPRLFAPKSKMTFNEGTLSIHGKIADSKNETVDVEFPVDQIVNVDEVENGFVFRVLRDGIVADAFIIVPCRKKELPELISRLPPARSNAYSPEEMAMIEQLSADVEIALNYQNALDARCRFPIMTFLIAAICIIMFIITAIDGGVIDTDVQTLSTFGANGQILTLSGEWWRLITHSFLHGGIIHLVFNMAVLFQLGYFVEKIFGHLLFTFIYLGSGIAGGLLSMWFSEANIVVVGASGSIFGLMGAMIAYLSRYHNEVPKPMLKSLMSGSGSFLLINLIYSLKAGVSASSHFGGLCGGLVLGLIAAMPVKTGDVNVAEDIGEEYRQKPSRSWRAVAVSICILIMTALGLNICKANCPEINLQAKMVSFNEYEQALMFDYSGKIIPILKGEEDSSEFSAIYQKHSEQLSRHWNEFHSCAGKFSLDIELIRSSHEDLITAWRKVLVASNTAISGKFNKEKAEETLAPYADSLNAAYERLNSLLDDKE